jgi:transcription elongation GreA/GreB family factor
VNSDNNNSDPIEEEAAVAEDMKETESDLDRREWLRYQAERQRQEIQTRRIQKARPTGA